MSKLTFVLLPGMDGTGLLFEPFIQALGSEFSIKTIGYPPDKPLGYPELINFVQRLLPTKGQFVLLGESFSGPIAISIAASRPLRLVGLILCCTFVRNPLPRLAFTRHFISYLPFVLPPAFALNYLFLTNLQQNNYSQR